jgi:hypothetical protein
VDSQETLIQELRRRNEEAKQQRAYLLPTWQKISRYILPQHGRYFVKNQRDRKADFGDILDNTASWAHGVFVAGMSAGAFPASVPWAGLRMRDPELAANGIGAEYCEAVSKVVHAICAQSNVYPALRHCVAEMGAFGPGCLVIEEHDENVIHLHKLTAGTYCVDRDFNGYVVALYRELVSTVGAVVDQFGYDRCSTVVRQAWDQRRYSDTVELLHVIDERKRRDPTKLDSANMPWRSVYIDQGARDDEPPLRESGYPFMPVLCPRAEVVGDDTYGTSQAMKALGDTSGLQHKHVRIGEATDKMTRIATQGPADIEEVNTMPGMHTRTNGAARIEPLAVPVLPIQHLWQQIVEGDHLRIARAFYVDVFQAFLGDTRSGTTAREIMARLQEKIQGLGPLLGNVDHELLRPLVHAIIWFAGQRGMLPPAPEDIAGQEMEVELSGPLYRALKAEQSRGTMQLIEMVAQLGLVPGWEQVRDRVDIDAAADELRDTFGAPARVLKSVREVQSVRDARAKMQAAQQQAAMAQQMAGTAKDLAQSPVEPGNALGRMSGEAAQ